MGLPFHTHTHTHTQKEQSKLKIQKTVLRKPKKGEKRKLASKQ
jgi:hypothetical protein